MDLKMSDYKFEYKFVHNTGRHAFDEGFYFVCVERGATIIANPVFDGELIGMVVGNFYGFPEFIKRYWWLSDIKTSEPCEALRIIKGEIE